MFALTLHFHSPRAYKYIREKFNNNLPNKRTIQKWYANCNVSGADICEQSLDILAKNADKLKSTGTEPVCALIFDEMSIKKHLQWSCVQKIFLGPINYGFRPESSEVPLAKEAIVFMVNGINFNSTLPLAYYFIKRLNSDEKAVLLKRIISAVRNCGVRVLSVTFDNLVDNFAMCDLLGCNVNDADNYKPHFLLPGDERKIYLIIDPCHLLKLARNILGKHKIMYYGDRQIDWNFFESLEELRIEGSLRHTHKMTKKHMQYTKFKMNVRIAAETLSDSVANSMQTLMDLGQKNFANCSTTIQYIRFINDAFDIMNTKDTEKENIFKQAINSKNEEAVFTFFDKLTDYLKQLEFSDGTLIISSKTKAAFRGFIINAINFKCIYEEYVKSNLLKCLPTFKFSQDHLESFFGRIRSLPGCNDNPTVEQFCAAFKKLVVCDEVRCSEKSNCEDKLELTILDVSSRRKAITDEVGSDSNVENYDDPANIERLNEIQSNFKSNDLTKMSIAHIADIIERRIERSGRFECGDCRDIFSDNEKLSETFVTELTSIPCQSTFDICETAEKYVWNLSLDFNYTFDNAMSDIWHEFDSQTAYSRTNFQGHETHKDYIVRFIITEYVNISATYLAKTITLKEQKLLLRNKYRKLVHFAGA